MAARESVSGQAIIATDLAQRPTEFLHTHHRGVTNMPIPDQFLAALPLISRRIWFPDLPYANFATQFLAANATGFAFTDPDISGSTSFEVLLAEPFEPALKSLLD